MIENTSWKTVKYKAEKNCLHNYFVRVLILIIIVVQKHSNILNYNTIQYLNIINACIVINDNQNNTFIIITTFFFIC